MKKIIMTMLSVFMISNFGIANAEMSKPDVEKIIKEYILNNPKVVQQSLDNYKNKLEEMKNQELFSKTGSGLYNEHSPVFGNVNGDVTLVEFFDYNCGYCRQSFKNIASLVDSDKNLKVIFKEFPILSEQSLIASKWALAAKKQGRYMDFHTGLMEHDGRINVRALNQVAEKLKLNVKRLKQDAESKEVQEEIDRNRTMATELKITGTPAFIVGQQVYSGALGVSDLQNLLKEERKKK